LVEDPVKLTTAIVTEHDQRFGHGSIVVRAKFFRHTQRTCRHKGREYEMEGDEIHTFDVKSIVPIEDTLTLQRAGRSRFYYLDKVFDDALNAGNREFES